MKIFILYAVIAVVVLAACSGELEREKRNQREAEEKAIKSNLRSVDYKGHTYIVYREIYGTKNFGGITHDPECRCHRP